MNRILAPDRVNIGMQVIDSPHAHPLSVVMQKPGEMQLLAFGGLTKLEMLAGQIAAGLTNPAFFRERGSDGLADDAVRIAIAVLARCQQVTNEQLAAKQEAEHAAALAAGVKPLEPPANGEPKSRLVV